MEERKFAQIVGEDILNIIVADNQSVADSITKSTYGNDAYAVECTRWSVGVGDKYINGVFVDKGTMKPSEYIPTAGELAHEALTRANACARAICDLALKNSFTTWDAYPEVFYYAIKDEYITIDDVPTDVPGLKKAVEELLILKSVN